MVKPRLVMLVPIAVGVGLLGGILAVTVIGPRGSGRPGRPAATLGGGLDGREMLRVEDRAAMARRLGQKKVPSAVPYLLGSLKDRDPKVRAACAWALGQIGDRKAAIDLKFRLDNETDPEVRPVLEEALALLSDEAAIRRHIERLADPDPAARLESASALAAWRSHDLAIRGLLVAMSDEDAAVHRAAAGHLGRIGSVAFHLLGEGVRSARPGALEVLVAAARNHGAADAVPALLAVLGVSDPRLRPAVPPELAPVRDAAIEALAGFGNMAIAPLLDAAFEARGGTPLQEVAAEALRRIGTPAVAARLTVRIEAEDQAPAEKELALWTDLLTAIGGDEADEALARIALHVEKCKRLARLGAAGVEIEEVRMGPPGAVPGDLANAVYALVFDRALPGGRPLTVHLDRVAGRWTTAFATAAQFSKVGHEADAADLELQKDRLAGACQVTLCPDPWVLKAPVPCRLVVLAAVDGENVAGTYKGVRGTTPVEGQVWGLVQDRRPVPEPAWVHVCIEDALTGLEGIWYDKLPCYHHRAHVSFVVGGGRTVGGAITMWDQRYPNTMSCGWSGVVEGVEADLGPGALRATVRAIVRSARGPPISWGRHRFVLEGGVAGKAAAGTFQTFIEDVYIKNGRFFGVVEPAGPRAAFPPNCHVTLNLDGAIPDQPAIWVPLEWVKGAFRGGVINVGDAPVATDPSGLRLDDRRLLGDLRLNYAASRGRPARPCIYTLQVDVSHPRMTGTFAGVCGDEKVSGPVVGEYRPRFE